MTRLFFGIYYSFMIIIGYIERLLVRRVCYIEKGTVYTTVKWKWLALTDDEWEEK